MIKGRIMNALGIVLAALIMAAGFLVPKILLAQREKEYLRGEWSEVSIGGETYMEPSGAIAFETPSEKRLAEILAFASSIGSKDMKKITGAGYLRKANDYVFDHIVWLVNSGALPDMVGWTVAERANLSSVSVSGDVDGTFLASGVTKPVSEAGEIGLVAINLWIADVDLRGSVSVLADSGTGRIIDLSVTLRGFEMDDFPDSYGMLWAYASYLGLSAQDGFMGSIDDDRVTISLGGASVSFELKRREKSLSLRLSAASVNAASVSSEAEATTTPEP